MTTVLLRITLARVGGQPPALVRVRLVMVFVITGVLDQAEIAVQNRIHGILVRHGSNRVIAACLLPVDLQLPLPRVIELASCQTANHLNQYGVSGQPLAS